MKATLSAILFSISVLFAQAQNRKAFLAADGTSSDSLHAGYYLLIHKASDTAYTTRQYDTKNIFLLSGTYKDEQLAMPHGVFSYFDKTVDTTVFLPHSNTYLKAQGRFYNGKKEGLWTEYYENGSVQSRKYYINNELNGPFVTYDLGNRERSRGTYSNGVKTGVVEYLNEFGNTWKMERYQNGERTKIVELFYKEPEPPKGFKKYIESRLKMLSVNTTNINMLISATVTSEGKLTAPYISSNKLLPDAVVNSVYELLTVDQTWTPASIKENNAKVDFKVWMALEINEDVVKLHYPVPAGNPVPMPPTTDINDKNVPVYALIKTEPKMKGGNEVFFEVFRRLVGPARLRDKKVKIDCLIDKNGNLAELRVSGSQSDKITNDIVNLIKKNIKWEPGYENGEPVEAEYRAEVFYSGTMLMLGRELSSQVR